LRARGPFRKAIWAAIAQSIQPQSKGLAFLYIAEGKMSKLSGSIHTGLFVDDIARMVTFYRDILGLATDWTQGPFASFEARDGGLFLFDRKLFCESMGQPFPLRTGYNTTMEIGFCVGSPEAVDEEYVRLSALGVESLTGAPVTQPWGQRNFFFADPEGNYIEIGS
jgi:lactoylglutathione lyase